MMYRLVSRESSQTILVFIGSVAIMMAAFLFGLELANAGNILRGVSVAGVAVGGHLPQEATTMLDEASIAWLDRPLVFEFPARNFRAWLSPRVLGVNFDVNKTIEEVSRYGRRTNMLVGIWEHASAVLKRPSIPFIIEVKEPELHGSLAEAFKSIEEPAQNATLRFDEQHGAWLLVPSKTGHLIDRAQVTAAMENRAARLSTQGIILTELQDVPAVRDEETADAAQQALTILDGAPYKLHTDAESWQLTRETIIEFLSFAPEKKPGTENITLGIVINRERGQDFFLREVAPVINRPPKNAQFIMKDGRVTAFALSQRGEELLINESIAAIEEGLRNGQKSIALVIHRIEPEVTTDSIDKLGIRTLLAVGESDFSGSPKNRIHNIKVGAARYNGVLIKPEEEFSFNKILGNVGPEEGYLPELVIKQDKTVPEYGGGLCQVSTTAFRAAVKSGLEITQRYPHAYVVRYYGTPGFDATIYPPSPDLRFRNDTPAHILIQTRVEKTKLFFEFYGTDDGRKVKIIGPAVSERNNDGSAKATLTQELRRDGDLIRKKTFFSSYRSPNLYPVSRRNPLE